MVCFLQVEFVTVVGSALCFSMAVNCFSLRLPLNSNVGA